MGKKEAVKSSEGKKKKELFVDSSSEDEEEEATNKPSVLKINRKYATEFETRKQREELINSRRYGEVSDDDDSSSDESEDEDGELLTPALDVKILQVRLFCFQDSIMFRLHID
jgi:protein KRI1